MAVNDGSILDDVKKVLGIASDYDVFDTDIILFANSAFSTLHQLGVGPAEGFSIEDNQTKWSAFVSDNRFLPVKSYISYRVRLAFDPPTTSFGIEAIKDQIKELEWRLNVSADTGDTETSVPSYLVTEDELTAAIQSHVNDDAPHPAYDEDIQSLSGLFENGMA